MSIQLRNEVNRLSKVVETLGQENAALTKRVETCEALVGELSKVVQEMAEPSRLRAPLHEGDATVNGEKGNGRKRA